MKTSKPIPRVSAKKYRGLGDVIEAVAKPVAKVIDRIAGTDIQNCQDCSRRQQNLNAKFPFRP